jgi:hypothetical protein
MLSVTAPGPVEEKNGLAIILNFGSPAQSEMQTWSPTVPTWVTSPDTTIVGLKRPFPLQLDPLIVDPLQGLKPGQAKQSVEPAERSPVFLKRVFDLEVLLKKSLVWA